MRVNTKMPDEITDSFDAMFKNAQTKLIGPAIAYTVIRLAGETGKKSFTAQEIRKRYQTAVCELVQYVGYNLHLGARFDNAYISRGDRGVGRFGILQQVGKNRYELSETYCVHAVALTQWIPWKIKGFLDAKLGLIVKLADPTERLRLAEDNQEFLEFLQRRLEFQDGGVSFEIISFAVLKVYLERFACRIYRDTRTFSHEGGTDLSTDFGAVYQIKQLRITHTHEVDKLYSEIHTNFDADRIRDGRVVVIIDDISPECKPYLLKKNSLKYLKRADLLEIASIIKDAEDRQKILRIVYEEFRREYANDICAAHGCDGHSCPVLDKVVRQ